ncbi:hypothetical protein MUK42_36646 [Musa troglodytarum]|uniref:Uncharacterized protein n=1 Tax=Musa troglodytarum TaxID=320322 RepID=A0A9E7HSS6_9LILI|nr:hypothetical protein MUK42_36646 [Musa troglodytarum]
MPVFRLIAAQWRPSLEASRHDIHKAFKPSARINSSHFADQWAHSFHACLVSQISSSSPSRPRFLQFPPRRNGI